MKVRERRKKENETIIFSQVVVKINVQEDGKTGYSVGKGGRGER